MNYTQEQKDLLLDKLFDGVVCLNIYRRIDIIHKNNKISWYKPKYNFFWLNYHQIWQFFENKNGSNYQEIKDLTEGILKDLIKQKELTTAPDRTFWHIDLKDLIKQKELTTTEPFVHSAQLLKDLIKQKELTTLPELLFDFLNLKYLTI